MPYPPELTNNEINQYYQTPEPPPPPNTYEVALVLGGTVSAGAYTAGVLDFLIEALDQWTTARDTGQDVPTHKVVLKVITGTSGGGINAMIMAKALGYYFPPFPQGSLLNGASNPFYNIWVQTVKMLDLLNTSDLNDGSIPSLLNDHPRDEVASAILNLGGAPTSRSYAGYPASGIPLRIIQTLSSLGGIPYLTEFPEYTERFFDHADYIRYAAAYDNLASNLQLRPDEYLLPVNFDPANPPHGINLTGVKMADWVRHVVPTSKGTSTFPAAFPPPFITRDLLDYRWRVAVTPMPPGNPGGPYQITPLVPDWGFMEQSQANFSGAVSPGDFILQSLDGGLEDNEPIKLALDALKGYNAVEDLGPNAFRGMILVDPLLQITPNPPKPATGLIDAFGQTIFQAFLEQTRYDSSDIALGADPDVYSRFLIYPKTPSINNQPPARIAGDRSLTSAGCGAFIGFACEDYLHYDYMLGRANCQAFLKTDFVVEKNNPVVAGQWSATQLKTYGLPIDLNGKTYVPLIPLVGTAANPQKLADWPVGVFDPESLRDAIKARMGRCLAAGIGGFSGWAAGMAVDGSVADFVINKMMDDMKTWGLRPPP